MKCGFDQDLLQELLDSNLDPSAQRAVRQHLAECPQCQAEFRRLEVVYAGLSDWLDAPVSPRLAEVGRQVLTRLADGWDFSKTVQAIDKTTAQVRPRWLEMPGRTTRWLGDGVWRRSREGLERPVGNEVKKVERTIRLEEKPTKD